MKVKVTVIGNLDTKVVKELFYPNADSIVVLPPDDVKVYFNRGQQTTFYSNELIKIEVLF